MIYADYEFYSCCYYGNVNEEDFQRLAVRASSFLDYYTQNRVKDYADLETVKMCCCALVDQYMLIDAAQELARKNVSAGLASDEGELQSETVGGYSRTLRSGGDSSVAALKAASEAKNALASVAREYLAHTGLLYRGRCLACTLPTL
mgnify:FL=1